jgi:hypothetical protein
LEVPIERLSDYELQGHLGNPTKALVALRVLAAGWKRNGQVLIAPKVVECSDLSPSVQNAEAHIALD